MTVQLFPSSQASVVSVEQAVFSMPSKGVCVDSVDEVDGRHSVKGLVNTSSPSERNSCHNIKLKQFNFVAMHLWMYCTSNKNINTCNS